MLKYSISKEIEWNIVAAIKTAIKSDAKESFNSIDAFILQSINNFFRKDQLGEFENFLKLVEQYYIVASVDKRGSDTSKIILERCSKRLYEVMFLPNYDFEKASFGEKERINKYKYQIFKSFNRIFFETIKNKDLVYFERNVEQINLIFMGDNPDLYPLSQSIVDNPTIEHKQNLFVEMKSQIYYNQTLLGVRYWIYFLYEKGQLGIEEMNGFLKCLKNSKKINTFFWEIEYLFSELNSITGLYLYDWNTWDYEEHREGESYSPPNVLSWIRKGYAIDSLKSKNLSIININPELISDNPQNRELLIGFLKKDIGEIRNNQKWQDYLGDSDDSNITKQLETLKSAFVSKKAKEIAITKLDDTLIENYRKRFLQAWKEHQTIRDIFNYFGKKIDYTGDEKLKVNGKKIYFENGKSLFINGPHHVDLLVLEDYGRQMNIDEETFFLNKVYETKILTIYESFIDGLKDSFNKIKDFTATAIIVDSNLLNKNGVKNVLLASDGFPKYSYKGIPVFTINNNILRNSFIIANFQEAFKMLFRSDEKLLDKELKVDVYEITQEILDKKLSLTESQNLSLEDRKNKILSSVIIDFEVIIDFIIENKDAFMIGHVEEV